MKDSSKKTCPACRRTMPADKSEKYCEICRDRHRGAAGRSEQRHAYYSVLHEDPTFVADLETLYNYVRPHIDDETPEDDAALRTFARRWHLPRSFISELAASLYYAKDGAALRVRAMQGHLTMNQLVIRPRAPEPFLHNPAVDPKKLVKQLSAEFADDLHQQIKRAREAALEQGWRPLARRLRTRSDLKILARRLYRRAVLGWPWDRIAAEEGPGVAAHAVRMSVSDWATALDVTLPKFPAGHPRKHK